MSDSTNKNYPIADAPTRDFSNFEDSDDALVVADEAGGEIPKRIGEYEIKARIGAGGMGQVYLAEHVRMQRIVAIKMLPLERMAEATAIERFYQEIRAASRLMHPNIVTAFDAGDVNGVHYLAMEYVDGLTLTNLVSKSGPLSVGQAAGVIRQAAFGLLHAHRAGIVHRDVKPGNLMRSSDGTVKVLDLGLAQISKASLVQEETSDSVDASGGRKSRGRLVGTLPYMSPEQLEDSETADARSDIYSLGATFFFLLTGQPPFVGEYFDQVYGHRHGEIPDLMQVRDDVDLELANIFRRMMAKRPAERYASMDEVVDDLSPYVSDDEAPMWLAELTKRQTLVEHATKTGGSTTTGAARVLSIDFGLYYSATAEASPEDGIRKLFAGGGDKPLFRMALASDGKQLILGAAAMERRTENPRNLAHSLPIYIGQSLVEREIAGRQCPPEVLLAILFRKIRDNAWADRAPPHATAITVPGCFDQLHRQSVLQAATMAGLGSIRLIDRSIASVQSLLIEADGESLGDLSDSMIDLDEIGEPTILFVGVSGQATEIAVFRRNSMRLSQLSSAGHWHTGTLTWLQRLVDLAAESFVAEHRFDPRKSIRTASRLQTACERAMNSLLLMPDVQIKIQRHGEMRSVRIDRSDWLTSCKDLASGVRDAIQRACREADVSPGDIQICVTQGSLMRMPTVRSQVMMGFDSAMKYHHLDRTDAARGAAACLAAELPGRRDIAMPPRAVTSQTIGIVVEDAKSRRRILPIIPKGTALPARTNRRLTVGQQRDSMTLSLVESSGIQGDHWQSLGRYEFPIEASSVRARMIGFELNINGMLKVRAQTPGIPTSTRLPALPAPVLSEESMAEWTKWIDQLR